MMSAPSPNASCPTRIISGGQTGVDRAALDVAIALGLDHGGWCPRGRRAEDGVIPDVYHLRETDSPDYAVRTRRNVDDADATLIIARRPLRGGTALTRRLAECSGKPALVVTPDDPRGPTVIRQWLEEHRVTVLNVAGPRESQRPGIHAAAQQLLELALG